MEINWKKLGKLLWKTMKAVLLASIGGGIVSATTGCSSLTQAPRGQTTEVVAFGVPAVAWISHTAQNAEHGGNDTNDVSQTNPVKTVIR